MKLIDKVTALPVITTLDIDVERVLQAAIDAKMQRVLIVGLDADGEPYFASSYADGGTALWDMEKAKRALMEISE